MDTNESPYRVSDKRSDDPYMVAWADLRRRRTMLWASFIGVPVVSLSIRLFPHAGDFLVPTLWASILFAMARVQLYSCPRCRDLYAMRDWIVGSMDAFVAAKCKHCGLSMGTAKKPMSQL